jgi:hypothetical protein
MPRRRNSGSTPSGDSEYTSTRRGVVSSRQALSIACPTTVSSTVDTNETGGSAGPAGAQRVDEVRYHILAGERLSVHFAHRVAVSG